jgi:hypothetical protein
MSDLQFLLLTQVMHTYMNNWLFACVMSIKKEIQLSGFFALFMLKILQH